MSAQRIASDGSTTSLVVSRSTGGPSGTCSVSLTRVGKWSRRWFRWAPRRSATAVQQMCVVHVPGRVDFARELGPIDDDSIAHAHGGRPPTPTSAPAAATTIDSATTAAGPSPTPNPAASPGPAASATPTSDSRHSTWMTCPTRCPHRPAPENPTSRTPISPQRTGKIILHATTPTTATSRPSATSTATTRRRRPSTVLI
jgi:hypothetical protein